MKEVFGGVDGRSRIKKNNLKFTRVCTQFDAIYENQNFWRMKFFITYLLVHYFGKQTVCLSYRTLFLFCFLLT